MREWLYLLGPIAIVFYFVIFPEQFNMLLRWAEVVIYSVPNL